MKGKTEGIRNMGKTPHKKKGCCQCHMNSLGSLGYCIMTLGLTAFIVTTEVQQLFKYLSLPWPDGEAPHLELNLFIGLIGGAVALVPFFFCASAFKIGNFANDGYRLGVHDSSCSRDPSPLPHPSGGFFKGIWRHGGPTGPFIHLIISHALLMARLVMEAAIMRSGFLPRSAVWSSELTFLLPQYDRISILDRLEFYSGFAVSPTRPDTSGVFETSSSLVFTDASSDLQNNNNNNNNSNSNNKGPTSALGLDRSLDVSWNKGDAWHVGEIPWGPFTPHFINYLLAHLVYAGRYAGVFWGTSKGMGFLFLIQMLLNAAQNILAINGFQVLYKVQVVGFSHRVLPVDEGFLLPFEASVALYCASQTLVLASGCVIYLYGYVKFESFLSAEREKYHILSKHGHSSMWSYWPHCWSLTILVLMTGSLSPLIYDWTIVYRASLDSATLAATCGTVTHLFLWILLWMALTIKSQWHFKLRVQVSKTIVTNTHSIRLVNEVQLSQQAEESEGPIMVIGSGKTYLLQEESPKRALMKLVLTTLTEKKARGEEEEIYWLRPKGPPSDGSTWGKKKASPGVKHKVTFHEDAGEGSSKKPRQRQKMLHANPQGTSDSDSSIDSDGDYARLRNVSFPGPTRQVTHQDAHLHHQEHHSLQIPSSRDGDDLSVGNEFPAPPPELTNPAHYPPPPDTPPPPLPSDDMVRIISSPNPGSPLKGRVKNPIINVVRGDLNDVNGTARDSAMIGDCPDSSSTSSSVTPPDKRSDSGVHSQTSTGSHSKSGSSGSESCVPPMQHNNNHGAVNESPEALPPPPPTSGMHRCSSVDELCALAPPHAAPHSSIKSYSLQPGALPPNAYQYQQMHNNHHSQQVQQYQRLQYEAHHQQAYQQQQSHNNNNSSHQQNNNERILQIESPSPSPITENTSSSKGRLNIEVVGGGYGFLPPAKFVASEPVYSDASTPVAIRRRSSVTAVEPETPPYERSSASFSTFTEPPLPRAILRGSAGLQHALSAAMPGKAMTVGGQVYRARRPPSADAKHATITGAAMPKGFHQPAHVDSRYFSVPAVKPQGTRIYPAPEPNPPLAHTLIHK